MKRKLIVVFMTIVMAVSLAFGMSIMTVGAADELTLGAVTSTSGSSVEIGCTQFTTGKDEDELNVNDLSNVTLTTNGTTYNASHVRQILSRKAFKVYFNGSGYNFSNAVRGDLITVKAGTAFGKYPDIAVSADINYIFTGSSWIKGTEVPTEAEALVLGDVSLTSGTQIEISSTQFVGGDEAELTNNGVSNIVLTAADGESYTPSHVRQMTNARKAFKLYFNNVNGSGKKYSFDSAAKGDILTIKKGFKITGNSVGKSYNLEVKEDINYIYTGSAWISGTELPSEVEIAFPATISATAWNSNTEIRIPTSFAIKNSADLKPTADTLALVKVVSGDTTYNATNIYEWNGCLSFYFNNTGYTGKTAKRGDILSVGAGFTVNHNGTTYVCADGIKYIFNGLFWVKGDTLAQQTELELPDTLDVSYWSNNTELRIPSNIENKDVANLNPAADALALVKIVGANKEYKAAYIYGWAGSDGKGRLTFYFNNTGYTGKTPAKGDKLVIGKNFIITSGGKEFVCTNGKTYVFNGSLWVDEEDYIDYDKLTKNGIDTKEKELTLYKGDEFVLPELFYTYTTEVKVPETVDADDVTIENAPDMNTVNENGYRVTLKVGDFSVNITVKVLDTTELNVTDVAPDNSWSKIAITTDSVNKAAVTTPINEYVKYFVYERNGVQFTVSDYIIIQQKYLISVQVGKTSDNKPLYLVKDEAVKVGDLLTVKKGLPFINGERLTETVTYVYNGTKFVKLVEPETFDVDATMSVFVNGVKQINVKDDAAVTAVYKYASSDVTVATVSETGVVKGIKVGTAKITVSYKDVSKEITVTVSEEPAKKGIEIVSDIEIFYVPVATATADNNFTSMGYTLLARYLYVDGSVGDVFDVEASQIGDINYTVAGLKDLTITIGEFTATVKVNVYEYKNVTSFTSLGVSGYDVNDDRNQPGTWNGHMIIGMNSISTSKGNMLSTESSEKMSEYIVYETAEGNKYYGKADKDNDIIDRIGVWQLGTNLLIMIKPEGSNANVGYGSEDHWKSDASYGYVPVYKAGDKITFLAGMPIYAWKGSLDENNYPAEGKGCLIVEGYVTEDIVYYCYEEDGVKSLWQIYKEYTDFTVNPSVTLTVGGTGSIGAVKTPIDATTGKFTYESSDPAVVTVTKDGNLAGLGIGTATVTVTLTGGKDADGNALDPIVKTVTVTVKKGIKSVSGEITVTKGATIDLADYEITVRYTDGTEENISLGANNVIVEDIDTSVTGTTEYGVRVTIDGETKRGTLTVTVKDAKKGCKGDVVSVSSILGLAFVTAGVIIVRKKGKKA
jgi:uncharacterized protein YjdB